MRHTQQAGRHTKDTCFPIICLNRETEIGHQSGDARLNFQAKVSWSLMLERHQLDIGPQSIHVKTWFPLRGDNCSVQLGAGQDIPRAHGHLSETAMEAGLKPH